MGSVFSSPPDFWRTFDHGVERSRLTQNSGDNNLMTKYGITNKDLNKDNLAEFFIIKIKEHQETKDKKKALEELNSRLSIIYSRKVTKKEEEKLSKEEKDAILIIQDNYKENINYEEKIQEAISNANSGQNAGGSRKKSKKSRS